MITGELFIKERKTKLIETDMLPIDIFNATPANGMNAKIVIAGKTYDGYITIEHFIPKDRRTVSLPYLSVILVVAEKGDVLVGRTIERIISETGWTFVENERSDHKCY